MKKVLKRILIPSLVVTTAMALLVLLIPLKLVKTDNRASTYTLPTALSAQVAKEAMGMEVEQIIDYSMSLTASRLRFATRNDIDNGEANCIGYAQLCAAICNRALSANGIKGNARPVIGYVESSRINWCQVLKAIAPKTSYKNFVKDHDFVELTSESQTFHFDPSIYDVLGKKCLSTHNHAINQNY